jgi:hypothetical protein
MTFSAWVKRGRLGARQTIFSNKISSSGINALNIDFTASDTLSIANGTTADSASSTASTAVFRDPSAWYHVVVAIDTTLASGRVKVWVNNQQVISADPMAQNATLRLSNSAYPHTLGQDPRDATYYDGYVTETYYIDGQALTPSSFGETNTITGVWQPKKYTGTYGTNGFYLNFSDNSAATAAAIGKDSSGNGNNWTPNNISVTAGVTYDSMLDSPTQFGDGGNGRGNYCVLNPLTLAGSGTGTVTDGNLRLTSPSSSSTAAQVAGSIAPQSGRFYFESTFTTLTNASGNSCIGIQDASVRISGLSGTSRPGTNTWWISDDGNFRSNGGTITSSGLGSFSAGDIAMIAIDVDTGKAWIGKNGTWIGDPAAGTGNTFSSLPALIAPMVYASINTATSSVITANFGQRPFTYTPPTGFKALNTLNLPTPTILKGNQYFDIALYNNATVVSGLGFSPDLVWHKSRNQTYQHYLYDKVRGVGPKGLNSSSTAAEGTNDSLGIVSFDASGVTYSSDAGLSETNAVGWFWKASGATVTNTAGSISAQVNAGATQGFSIVTYTGTGANATVGHGLGVAPKMVIVKRRNSTGDWLVWNLNVAVTGSDRVLFLNATDAQTAAATNFNSTSPTSTVFSVGTNSATNANGGTYVAYLFSEVAGFSKFGSYTGNGSADGPFVHCGFLPRWIMFKKTSATDDWVIYDTARDEYNVASKNLYANGTFIEDSNTTNRAADILSNGFKLRSSGTFLNGSGATFIFAAFAQNPFKNALAR